jgi:SAM-dependent methyltransferase
LRQYDAEYFRGEAGYRDYVAEEAVFRREFRRRLRVLRAAGACGRLLDVGAASGAFLEEARGAGFEVAGVEPSPGMASHAAARGLRVWAAPIEAADVPRGSFDVVTCFDVLEHVVDPVAALRRFRDWLAPGGRVALCVPDFGGWWARLSGARWAMVTPREHLHYFTRRTLARALRVAGFSRPSFGRAGTAASYGTIALEALGPLGGAIERALGHAADRGFSLPFGTIFSWARRGPEPDADARGGSGGRRGPGAGTG